MGQKALNGTTNPSLGLNHGLTRKRSALHRNSTSSSSRPLNLNMMSWFWKGLASGRNVSEVHPDTPGTLLRWWSHERRMSLYTEIGT